MTKICFRMYHLLETVEDGTKMATVVPEEWILDFEKKQFTWPNKQNAGNAWVCMHKMPCSNWQICTFSKILHSSVLYAKIRALDMNALDESDVLGSLSEAEPQRLSRPTRRWSPDETDYDSSDPTPALKKAPKQRSSSPLASSSRSLPPAPTPPLSLAAERAPLGFLPSGYITPGYFGGAAEPSSNFIHNLTNLLLEKQIPFYEKILSKLEQLSVDVKLLSRKVDRLEAKSKVADSDAEVQNCLPSLPEGFNFPLTQVEEVEALNSALADPAKKQKMIFLIFTSTKLYLANNGGKNAKNGLFRLMKMLFAPTLSIRYSLHGKKGKLKFSEKSNIMTTIFDAIMCNFTITVRDLELFTGDWLATSTDRSGGRKRRKEQMNNPVSSC